MDIYTVTREENYELQSALEICWEFCYPDVESAKAAVLLDVRHFRKSDGVGRGAPVEWCVSEDTSALLLEDNDRTWTIFKTQLISS